MRLIALLALLIAAGCSMGPRDYVIREGNYLTYEHPFNDAAADKSRLQADRYCAESRLIAVRTRSTCTMTTCLTDFQCMTADDAARVAPPDVRKK